MNIAIAADGKDMDSQVSEQFEKCEYLLIVDMDDLSITAIKNDELEGNLFGESLSKEVLKHDCESVVTCKIKDPAFDILADAYVTRFNGGGHSVEKVLELMEKRSLEFIKYNEGKNSCSGDHH